MLASFPFFAIKEGEEPVGDDDDIDDDDIDDESAFDGDEDGDGAEAEPFSSFVYPHPSGGSHCTSCKFVNSTME